VISPEQVKRRVAEVTAAQVRRCAQDFFRAERLCLAIVGPLKSARGLAALLRL